VPIRFRCAYCNQLMGIARRKAGTVVRCPTCSGQVVVPDPDGAPPEEKPTAGAPRQGLFERSDFDQVFDVPSDRPALTVPGPEASAPAPAGAWGTHAEPALDVERLDPSGPFIPMTPSVPRSGVVLTSGQLTMLTVGAVLLLAAVFGAGVLVGRYLLGGS
jgi:phage FluMu protein Com